MVEVGPMVRHVSSGIHVRDGLRAPARREDFSARGSVDVYGLTMMLLVTLTSAPWESVTFSVAVYVPGVSHVRRGFPPIAVAPSLKLQYMDRLLPSSGSYDGEASNRTCSRPLGLSGRT